jgi:short subunit fatty acids transporter
MIGSISLLIGYLMAMLNLALFLLVFFILLEVIRDLKLFEMPAAIIIAACAAFVFIAGVPLSSAMEQLLSVPQRSIGEVILKSVEEVLPMQILLIMIGTSIWAIIKGTSPKKQNGRNER